MSLEAKDIEKHIEQIRDERREAANTAKRVGSTMMEIFKYVAASVEKAFSDIIGGFLRKDQDDETTHKLTMGEAAVKGNLTLGANGTYSISKEGVAKLAGVVAEYLKSSNFRPGTAMGFDGQGYGITKNGDKYTLEIDNLIARMKMIVAELEVHEMSFIGGTVVMSACGNRVARVEAIDGDGSCIAAAYETQPTLVIPEGKVADKFRCYFLATDGSQSVKNEWTVGQLARCKTNNIAKPGDYTNYENREYWRLVVGVSKAPVTVEGKSYHYIELSNSTSKDIALTDAAGTERHVTLGGVCETMASLPYAGDNIVGMGHCWDTAKQNVAILSVVSLGWSIYQGIDNYDLPEANIVNKFGIDKSIMATDRLILRPYAAPKESQTVAVVRGAYSDDTYYGHNDMTTLDGQLWIGDGIEIGKTIKGERPSASSPYWSLAAAKGIQGPKGDGYSISFLLNNVPVDVINFDTVKGLEGTNVSLEADFYNNAVAANVNKATVTCYDADGNVLGSPIEATNADNIVVDGGSLYLSKLCAYITTIAYDADGKMLVSKSIGVVRNGESVGVKSVTYKVLNDKNAGDALNWDSVTAQTTYPTQKPPKGKYCYVMTIVTYTDGTSTNTVSTSYTPTDGKDVTTSVSVTYARSTTNVQPSDFPLTAVPSDLALGEYLWSKTVVTYTGANTQTTASIAVSRVGKDGAVGYSLHILYSNVEKPTQASQIATSMQNGYDYIYVYSDQSTDDDVSKGVEQTFKKIKGGQGIPGDKGDGYAISFLLNGVPVDVINFDTVKGLSNVASFEADLTNNGAACNANRATLTCYDAEGSVLGSPIDVTDTNAVVADGGNLYLSKDCKNITAQFYGANNVLLKEKSVAVMRDTQMYALKQLNTTRATVKASDSTTSATFALDAELHFQVVKNTGGNTENPTITSIKATAGGETFSNSAVNNTEATLTCKGTVAYNATNRPPSTIQVEVVCEGKTLYATVPVTMEAGVAIDINQNLGTMSVTVKGQSDAIATLQSDGKTISARVSSMDEGLSDTGVDIENRKITATANKFVVNNNSGDMTFYIDQVGNIVGNGNASFQGTITGSAISGSTIKSEDGTYKTTIQGGSITTNNIAAAGGSIGAWKIQDGGLSAEYGSDAKIHLYSSSSFFELDSNMLTGGGYLLRMRNDNGGVMHLQCYADNTTALSVISGGANTLAISSVGNNNILSLTGEGTVINRLAYACVRVSDTNVYFDQIFMTRQTGDNKIPGNMIVTTNETTDQTVWMPKRPVLGLHLLVIQGTNRWVNFNGYGHEFIRGREHSSTANSKAEGQWNYFIWDGSYWRCIFLNSGKMW